MTQVKYPNATAMDPMTAMMFRPAKVFHQGAKIMYSNANSTETTVVL
jgi:hypothetical protein